MHAQETNQGPGSTLRWHLIEDGGLQGALPTPHADLNPHWHAIEDGGLQAQCPLHTPTVMALVRQQRSPPVPPLAFWGALVLQTHSTQVPTTGEPMFAKQRKSTIQAQHPNHAMA